MATNYEPELFEHGIHTEKSHIRAHVGVILRCVYVYQTHFGVAATERKNPDGTLKYSVKPAFQDGVKGKTATGFTVPWEDIEGCRQIKPQGAIFTPLWDSFGQRQDTLSTSAKGKIAVDIVRLVMKLGRFPVWFNVDETTDSEIQIEGTDIILWAHQRIQVKCDWRGGNPNLYLQNSERNPLSRH